MSILVRKTLDAIRKLKQCDLPEETMLFMPIFFELLDLDSGLYQSLFVTVIEICCDQELPNLFEKSLQLCLNLIKIRGNAHKNILLEILDPFLDKKITI